MDKSSLLDICNANDVVVVKFIKADGTLRVARTSFKRIPGELAGKGMRAFKDDQVQLFDIDKVSPDYPAGNWITVKLAKIIEDGGVTVES